MHIQLVGLFYFNFPRYVQAFTPARKFLMDFTVELLELAKRLVVSDVVRIRPCRKDAYSIRTIDVRSWEVGNRFFVAMRRRFETNGRRDDPESGPPTELTRLLPFLKRNSGESRDRRRKAITDRMGN
jgi:hypothetical protein